MRILLVTALVAGGVGGHVRMLATGLARAGHQVVVACPEQVATRFALARTGAVVVPVEVGSRARPWHDLAAVRQIAGLAVGADVVHAHGVRAGALCALALAGRRDGPASSACRGRPGPPLVVTTHNAPPAARAGRAVYGLLERVVAARADLVLGVSPDLVDRADRAGARQTGPAVVPADLTQVVPVRDRADARAQVRTMLALVDGQQLVLTVGRLGAQKRTDEVIAAHQACCGGTRPATVLAVAGDGPERDRLAEQARTGPGDVRLLGRRDDVPALLAAADVVVSGAQWEGQPLWLQEALGTGAAIVATDVGGTGVVVGDAAVLVRAGPGADRQARVRALARALSSVLQDEGLRAELAARARHRAAELPTADDAVAAVLAAYARAGATTYPHRRSSPDHR